MDHDTPLRAFRERKRWTRAQFVEQLFMKSGVRVSVQMVSHVENRIRHFGPKVGLAIEQAFKLSYAAQRAVELRDLDAENADADAA